LKTIARSGGLAPQLKNRLRGPWFTDAASRGELKRFFSRRKGQYNTP
jgi:hypothetical protein